MTYVLAAASVVLVVLSGDTFPLWLRAVLVVAALGSAAGYYVTVDRWRP